MCRCRLFSEHGRSLKRSRSYAPVRTLVYLVLTNSKLRRLIKDFSVIGWDLPAEVVAPQHRVTKFLMRVLRAICCYFEYYHLETENLLIVAGVGCRYGLHSRTQACLAWIRERGILRDVEDNVPALLGEQEQVKFS